jgi:hypothetical protein
MRGNRPKHGANRLASAASVVTIVFITFISIEHHSIHSTVTDFARFRGWSTSHPRKTAMW